jgi:hypothetical protein
MYSMFLDALPGSSTKLMNVSAVPGCSALAGIAKQSVPTGIPSEHFWNE